MVGGLSLTSFALLLQTRIDVDTGYAMLLPAFVLMGIGMALVMSPMSTAAMNSVAPEKAGVGSGILTMSRMVGGTFGVAAIGALFQHLASSQVSEKLAGTGVTAAQRDQIVHNLGAARDGGGALPAQAVDAAREAFIFALSHGMWLSAGVSALGAVVAFCPDLAAGGPPARPGPRHPEAAAEARLARASASAPPRSRAAEIEAVRQQAVRPAPHATARRARRPSAGDRGPAPATGACPPIGDRGRRGLDVVARAALQEVVAAAADDPVVAPLAAHEVPEQRVRERAAARDRGRGPRRRPRTR